MQFDPIQLGPHEWVVPTVKEFEVTPRVVTLRKGDILHVKIGIADMGDGRGPWVPSNDELDGLRKQLQDQFPDNRIYVTHFGMEFSTVLRVENDETSEDE